jgi:hypothetical protein
MLIHMTERRLDEDRIDRLCKDAGRIFSNTNLSTNTRLEDTKARLPTYN